jgi:hypothetical protein
MCMSSTVSPAAWLQAAIGRSVHASAAPATSGRHRAPEMPEWSRVAFDPARDVVDAFDWLGFEAAQD